MLYGNVEYALVKAIEASIENHKWCIRSGGHLRKILYKMKYEIWYLCLALFSPHKQNSSKIAVFAMTPVNEKQLKEYTKGSEIIRLARLNNTLGKIRHNYSVLSPYSIIKRFLITENALFFYIKHGKELKGYLHFTLEYYSIAKYLIDQNIIEIVSPGMYERYSTFLSYFAHGNNIIFTGVQDGAAIDIGVPRKVYCTTMHCFDTFEEKVIRNFVMNTNCKYIHTGFKTMLNWSNLEKKGKIAIGIASQDWHTSKTIELLECILRECNDNKYMIIVFPHYREKEEQYINLKLKYPNLIIKSGDRYRNIDILITFYSTIVYDYWAVNPNLIIKCLRMEGFVPSYYQRDNVEVYDDIGCLIHSLLEGDVNEM